MPTASASIRVTRQLSFLSIPSAFGHSYYGTLIGTRLYALYRMALSSVTLSDHKVVLRNQTTIFLHGPTIMSHGFQLTANGLICDHPEVFR